MSDKIFDNSAGVSPNGDRSPQEQSPSDESPQSRRRPGARHRLADRVPTLLAMALLVGLGVYGHRSDWKLPRLSSLTGSNAGRSDDWCEEHSVPESQCVECHPELLPRGKDFGWCKEHGVDNCPLCHPEIAQLKKTPIVTETDRARAARALESAVGPENNPICKNYRRRIQFASLEAVKKAGVDVALVERRPISESLSVNGEITYDQTRFASLSSRLAGTVWRVEKRIGDRVRAGEVLALVEAAEVGRAKAELLQALAEDDLRRKIVSRLTPGSSDGVVAGRELEKAQAEQVQAQARLLCAQQMLANLGLPVDVDELRKLPETTLAERLRLLGLPPAVVARLGTIATTSNLLPLKAPMDGVAVARNVVAGEVADTSRVLFQLADVSRMWLMLSIPLGEAGRLALGQPVHFQPDGSQAEVVGKLEWISTTADRQTRMIAARVELPNPRNELRSETFGAGRIVLREEPEAIVVPNEAVHWEGCCHVVFVRDKGYFDGKQSPKVFHVRTVRLGAKTESHSEIVAGVLPGEVVATKGSDVLRAELLKNNLGEGCCCCK
jgi:membrane fusion protein, heavy metal efflux system